MGVQTLSDVISINGWKCTDIGTAKYQVYAPFDVKYKLEHECNLPHTGFTLLPLLLIGALSLICIGLAIRMVFRRP